MIEVVTHGREGTAMKSFSSLLNEYEIGLVVDYVRTAFMGKGLFNTLYHIPENGWYKHDQYRKAYPFAMGEIPIDTPWEQLTSEQQEGKRLFMSSCVICHDWARTNEAGPYWDTRAVSYPRAGYSHKATTRDAVSGATPFAKHDIAPQITDLNEQQRRGELLFQENCTFCHGADGTGKNWIGRFLEKHPRDLTDEEVMAEMTKARLRTVIRDGLADSTMPAWKNVLSDEQVAAIVAYISRAFYKMEEEAGQ